MEHPQLDFVREVFGLTGARWTIPVLATLRRGRMRFGDIARGTPGVAQKQLASTLRDLEKDGFVLRCAFATIPPRVDYELTELGQELMSSAERLGRFAVNNRDQIEAARRRFVERPSPVTGLPAGSAEAA